MLYYIILYYIILYYIILYYIMGPPSYTRSVVDRNVVMRRMTVPTRTVSALKFRYNIINKLTDSVMLGRYVIQYTLNGVSEELAASILRVWHCKIQPKHGGTALLRKIGNYSPIYMA